MIVPIETDGSGNPWGLAVAIIRLAGPVRGASMRNGQGDEIMAYDPVKGWYFKGSERR